MAANHIRREVCSSKGVIGLLLHLGDHFCAAGQGRFHGFDLESVNQRAGIGQGIDGRTRSSKRGWLTSIPSRSALAKRFFGAIDVMLELLQVGVEGAGGFRTRRCGPKLALLVTPGTDRGLLPFPASRRRLA